MTKAPDIFEAVERDYPDYLRDESRRTGRAEGIAFPKSRAELVRHVRYAATEKLAVTIQGARTGITGGAVPEGGLALNLSRLNAIGAVREADGGVSLVVEPGAVLSDIREAVRTATGGARFLPPDPTETSASIGGMIACNASGACSFRYGPTRRYVQALRLVLPDGDGLSLRRGECRAAGRRFELTTDSGRRLGGELPAYAMPAVKNAAGYFCAPDMDPIDLFIGAEGTLGVISEAELSLIPAPAAVWGVQAFLPSETAATAFVRRLRAWNAGPDRPAAIAALEFFDSRALDLLRAQKQDNPAFAAIPALAAEWHTAVYVEIHGDSDSQAEEAVTALSDALTECGGDAEAAWMAADERELDRLKAFRHALPEAVNLLIDTRRKREPLLTKLGTDLAVPEAHLESMLNMYHTDLDAAGLEHVVFGHIGDSHLHVNILPVTLADYERGKALYLGWARTVVGLGGTVSAEHGIGKLKKTMLREMMGEQGIADMRALKALFDPEGRLNPGNLF